MPGPGGWCREGPSWRRCARRSDVPGQGARPWCCVAGDAGVGKSRLVAEVAAEARADGVLVLIGHCVELAEGELPYAPVAGAVRALAAQLGPAELDVVLGTARGELARLAPVLGEGDVAPVGTGRFATARLFELLLGVLGRAGASAPVMLVFEDLHWADGSTRDLLRFLVRAAGEERLAVVATYRTDSLDRAHPLRPYVAELARDRRVEPIVVRPFSRAEFTDQVGAIRGELPSAGDLDRLFARSEGNPFYTEELLAAGDSGSLPASLRDVMLTRLERLSPPTQRVVRVLAAAGRRVDYALIAAVSGLADNDALRCALDGQAPARRRARRRWSRAPARRRRGGERRPRAARRAACGRHPRCPGRPVRSLPR